MKLLDYFFYILTMRLVKPLKKSVNKSHKDYPKEVDIEYLMKSCALFGLWVFIFIFFIATLISLWFNTISKYLLNESVVITVIILIFILIYNRYIKVKRFQKIVEWRNQLGKVKRGVMYAIFLICFWGMPIAAFVTYRLYAYGQVKWW